MEVNLQILGIKSYNKDMLLLVIPTTTYSEKILVVVRSKIIDRAMTIITKGELAKATGNRLISGLSCLDQYSCPTLAQIELGWKRRWSISPQEVTLWRVKEFCLEDVWGPVHTTQKVTIPPFGTVSVHRNTSVRGHCMQVHVLTEPMPGPQLSTAVVPTATYGELHLESSWVPIYPCN